MAFWWVQTGQNGPLKTTIITVQDIHHCPLPRYSAWSRYKGGASLGTILRNYDSKVTKSVQHESGLSGVKMFNSKI